MSVGHRLEPVKKKTNKITTHWIWCIVYIILYWEIKVLPFSSYHNIKITCREQLICTFISSLLAGLTPGSALTGLIHLCLQLGSNSQHNTLPQDENYIMSENYFKILPFYMVPEKVTRFFNKKI